MLSLGMAIDLHPSICAYGAGVLHRQLEAMRLEIPGIRQGTDIECIHRMRVASRRLRTALELFGGCLPRRRLPGWQNELRTLRQSLGEARDLDVQIEVLVEFERSLAVQRGHPGVQRLLLRRRQRRTAVQEGVLAAVDQLVKDGILLQMEARLTQFFPLVAESLPVPSPELIGHCSQAVIARLSDFLMFEPFVRQPQCIEELHQMRIAAKHLRYTIEAVEPLFGGEARKALAALRSAQEALGNIHDCDVWVVFLPAFMEKERERTLRFYGHTRSLPRIKAGVDIFLQSRMAARLTAYEGFVRDWEVWQQKGVWLKIRDAFQPPAVGTAPGNPEADHSEALPSSE